MSTAPSAAAHVARTHFQDELRELEERTIGGLDIVLEQLDRSLEAVAHQDIELASMVINDDDRIDGRYLEVHQTVLSLLARQTPVAGDLRVVAALLHIIRNVERMGDQCVNMCKVLPLTGNDAPTQPEILAKVARMGEVVRSEIWQARRAFADRDVAVAEDLLRDRSARVGDVHDAGGARARANRRQRCRRRRADGVRRDGPVQGVRFEKAVAARPSGIARAHA